MPNLPEALIEWVQGERVPLSRYRLVEAISHFARHSRSWPTATPRQWSEAIDKAVELGLLVELDGTVRLAAATEPPAKGIQLDLF